jgi:hypothetical protein
MAKAVANKVEKTAPKQRAEVLREYAFKPGQSGNPAGRPKGARHKLGSQFLQDLLSDFTKHGKQAIIDMRTKDVVAYCKTVASILPKEIDAGDATLSVLSEIMARIDGRTRSIVQQPAPIDTAWQQSIQ